MRNDRIMKKIRLDLFKLCKGNNLEVSLKKHKVINHNHEINVATSKMNAYITKDELVS